jgi:hypothetical protein
VVGHAEGLRNVSSVRTAKCILVALSSHSSASPRDTTDGARGSAIPSADRFTLPMAVQMHSVARLHQP